MSHPDLKALFVSHLPTIEKIVACLARRRRLHPDAAEDFSSWAKLRFIENDYAILAKFRGESSLSTYLTMVLAMLLREYHVQERGRWRPSAAAKRSGPLGIRLETLVHRDGMALAIVGNMLRSAGETALSDRELAAIVSTFPRRTPIRPTESDAALDYAESVDRADEALLYEEARDEQARVRKALYTALDVLDDEDRLIVRLRFMEGMSVAEVARALRVPQMPLYPRIKSALRRLRAGLEESGVSSDLVREWTVDPP